MPKLCQLLLWATLAGLLGGADGSAIARQYGVTSKTWQWRWKGMPQVHLADRPDGYKVRYQYYGDETPDPSKPTVVLVHGFGGNCEHWRKVMPMVAPFANCYAIDLLGFGFSDKLSPRVDEPHVPAKVYNFDTWGEQLLDFIDNVVKDDAFLVTNSVGGIAGMSAAIQSKQSERRQRVRGVQLISVSLRLLHFEKQPVLQRPLTSALQWTLRETPLGKAFFGQVATAEGVKSVLQQCYGDKEAVTDELVEAILTPGLEDGAADVFLDFISYSWGPLPERQLRSLQGSDIPVSILWGEKDPWEPIDMGRTSLGPEQHPKVVDEFVTLKGLGHCAMDENPEIVVPRIKAFVDRYQKA